MHYNTKTIQMQYNTNEIKYKCYKMQIQHNARQCNTDTIPCNTIQIQLKYNTSAFRMQIK